MAAPLAAPGVGLVDSHSHGHVKTIQPAQGGVTEHRKRPVPGGAEEGLRSSQIDLVGQDKYDCFPNLLGFKKGSPLVLLDGIFSGLG